MTIKWFLFDIFKICLIHILPLCQANSFWHHQNFHDLHSPPFWWWQPITPWNIISNYNWFLILFVVLLHPCFIFKKVSLVIRGVWVVKNLDYQRSLSRKLHKEASWGSFSRKPHEKAFEGSCLSCLGKSTLLNLLTIGSSQNLVWKFIRQVTIIWPLRSVLRCLACEKRFLFREEKHLSVSTFVIRVALEKHHFFLLPSSKTISNVSSFFSITIATSIHHEPP